MKPQLGPQMLKRALPVLQRPTAVDSAGEYRVIITRKQPDAGACSRKHLPVLECGGLEEFKCR